MKDSGIPWVGDIPEEWDVNPLRQYFTERRHKNANGTEDNLLSLSYGRIIRKDIDTSDGLLPANFLGYNIVEPGDIVFRMTDLQNDKRSLRSGIVEERGIITSAYIAAAPKCGVESRFHNYLQRAYDQLKVYYNMGGGVRQGINYDDLKRMPVLTPSIDEQQRIADYLDARCREIDAVKQTLSDEVEALQRLRKATIHKAVLTNLSDYPKVQLKNVAWVGSSTRVFTSEFVEEGIPFFRGTEIGQLSNSNFTGPTLFITYEHYMSLISQTGKISIGDLLLPSICYDGQIWVVDDDEPFYVKDGRVLWIQPNRSIVDSRFVKYALSSELQLNYELYASGTTFAEMKICTLKQVPIHFPPLEEQQSIASYLDERCAAIDSIIETRTKQLERLEDYRKALIFAYVTGKKEVPAA